MKVLFHWENRAVRDWHYIAIPGSFGRIYVHLTGRGTKTQARNSIEGERMFQGIHKRQKGEFRLKEHHEINVAMPGQGGFGREGGMNASHHNWNFRQHLFSRASRFTSISKDLGRGGDTNNPGTIILDFAL